MTGSGSGPARRWAGWLAVVLFGALAVAAATSALARPATPADPRLDPGAQVVVVESGFAPRAEVTVGLVGDHLLGTVVADAHGRVAYRYTVPAGIGAGAHALVFVGRPARLGPNRQAGNLVVAAPLVRSWRFRVGSGPSGGPSGGTSAPASGGHSSHPGHPGHGGGSGAEGASAGHGTNGGGTSATGTDVLAGLAVGVLALAGGSALVLAARRRPRRG